MRPRRLRCCSERRSGFSWCVSVAGSRDFSVDDPRGGRLRVTLVVGELGTEVDDERGASGSSRRCASTPGRRRFRLDPNPPSLRERAPPVPIGQAPKRSRDLGQLPGVLKRTAGNRQLGAKPVSQLMPAAIAAALICTYAPRHPVEPQPRRIASRNVIQAPPRGHKRLRDHIGRIICVVRAPQHISDHAPLILRVELLEPSTTSIKRSSHVMGLASLAHTLQDVHHTDRISARTPPSTKSAASPTAKPADGDPPSHAEAKSALPDPALTSHQRRATAHFGPEIALGVSTRVFFRRFGVGHDPGAGG